MSIHRGLSPSVVNRLRFSLHAVGEAAGCADVRRSSHETSESVRPIGIRHKKTQDQPAEEFTSRANLWGDRQFAELGAVEAVARGHAIESGSNASENMVGEEELRPGARAVAGSVRLLPWRSELRRRERCGALASETPAAHG